MAETFSIAVFETLEDHEGEALATIRELLSALAAKGYSRDSVYRQASPPHHYVLLRHWRSEQDRRDALEDPALQKIWARLGNQISIVSVYETLEPVA
jgi:heme-degrading monooxygenase HmoA